MNNRHTDLHILPSAPCRMGTGPVQFGDDWPGVFIRGDHAAGYSDLLRQVARALRAHGENEVAGALQGLRDLMDCDAGRLAAPGRRSVVHTLDGRRAVVRAVAQPESF